MLPKCRYISLEGISHRADACRPVFDDDPSGLQQSMPGNAGWFGKTWMDWIPAYRVVVAGFPLSLCECVSQSSRSFSRFIVIGASRFDNFLGDDDGDDD